MNILFTGSIADQQQNKKYYGNIVESLKQRGNNVIAEHILNTTEEIVGKKSKQERLEFQKWIENAIQAADCMVAETTIASVSVGYEIAFALRLGIPVLVLYRSGVGPSILAQHKNEKIVVEKYCERTLHSIVGDFLSYVKASKDMKFTFFLSNKFFLYIDEQSKAQKMPKSVYLRRLIEDDMGKKGICI